MKSEVIACLLCGDPAIAIFHMAGGCYCYPEVTIQPLCPQHIIQAHPLRGMTLLNDLRVDTSLPVAELYLPGHKDGTQSDGSADPRDS